MNSQLREQAITLRLNEELSYAEIGNRLKVPKSTLSYWLREFPFTEEKIKELQRKGWKKSEASRERFRITMRRKKEQKNHEIYKKYQERFIDLPTIAFFVAGLTLYLCEGNKKDYTKLDLANTDPKIIKFFIQWMAKFLDVPKEKIKVTLHLYENMDIEREKGFWRNELGIQETQFYKPSIRKLKKSSFSYPEPYRHGTCSLYVGGVEKKREVMMAIQALFDNVEKLAWARSSGG